MTWLPRSTFRSATSSMGSASTATASPARARFRGHGGIGQNRSERTHRLTHRCLRALHGRSGDPSDSGRAETAAAAPMPPLDMAQGFCQVSDDVEPALASLTAMGDFGACQPAGQTVGRFPPADCNTLGMPDPMTGKRPLAVLVCDALKATSCAAAPGCGFRLPRCCRTHTLRRIRAC